MSFNKSVLILSLFCFSGCLCTLAGPTEPDKRVGLNILPLQTIAEHEETENWEDGPQTYGVIVDCGSSGTRAHIYQWDTKLAYPELLHDIAPMRDTTTNKPVSRKFEPGLSSLADANKREIQAYIKRVIDYVKVNIPAERHPFTVIYVLATAGMRLLDDETQDRIMNEIKDYVRSKYSFRDITSSVISGALEGMYRWISVNSKAKRFLEKDTDEKTKTYAIIEMGGASAQVVYQLRPALYPGIRADLLSSDSKNEILSIYKKQIIEPQMSRDHMYRLHSTTFLGFGGDSAYEAYLDLLIRKQNSNDRMQKIVHGTKNFFFGMIRCFSCENIKTDKDMVTIHDPCAPRGYWSTKSRKPNRMMYDQDKTIGFVVDDDDENDQSFPVRIIGQGDYKKCRRYVEKMLWTAKKERLNCKPDELCTMELIGEKFIPFRQNDFIGIGDFYHTTKTMIDMEGPYMRNNILKKTMEICGMSLRKLSLRYKDVAKSESEKVRERLHSECFRAVWMDTFLVKGLGMPEDFGQFKTLEKINNEDPEWTLGAVLDKSNAILDEIAEGGDYLTEDDETQDQSPEDLEAPMQHGEDEKPLDQPQHTNRKYVNKAVRKLLERASM